MISWSLFIIGLRLFREASASCPLAYLAMIQGIPAPSKSPAFLHAVRGKLVPLTKGVFIKIFVNCCVGQMFPCIILILDIRSDEVALLGPSAQVSQVKLYKL